MTDQQTSISAEAYIQALTEQRNEALDRAAETRALLLQYKADVDRLTAENEKLRAESDDGPFSS